jgi:hypothetical protein
MKTRLFEKEIRENQNRIFGTKPLDNVLLHSTNGGYAPKDIIVAGDGTLTEETPGDKVKELLKWW